MARIGGAFPFPIPQIQFGGSRIELASGGVFYFPPGEYLVQTESHTNIEYWDGQSQSWQTLYPISTGGFLSADGFNFRARNIYGAASLTTISNAGSGMTNGIGSTATSVSAAVAASDTTGGATITLQPIVGGSVAAPTITQAGSGFLVPPLVVIDPPPAGGIQATAYAVLTAGGAISAVTMDNVGAGYSASPNFYLIPQPAIYQGGNSLATAHGNVPAPGLVYPSNAVLPGNQNTSSSGAQLTSIALTGSGTLTGLVVVNAGGGYTTSSPAVTFTGGAGGVAASVTVTNNTNVRGVVLSQPQVQ